MISDVDNGGNLAKWKLFQAEPLGGKHCSRWRGPIRGTELFIAHYSCNRQPLINHGNNDRWGTIETGSTSWNLQASSEKGGCSQAVSGAAAEVRWLRALNQRGSQGPRDPCFSYGSCPTLAPRGSLLRFEVLTPCPCAAHVLSRVLLCRFLIQSFNLLVWNRVVLIQS